MKFVVGIGNPEKKYEETRHNIGFRVIDQFALCLNPKPTWRHENHKRAWVFEAGSGDREVCLVKPDTYVNRSGMTLGSLAGRQDRAPEALVVCDDVNLDFGKLRLRASGSAGGHHGLESVIEVLGTEDFPRLRIGVKNENMPKDLAGFVLERFSGPEKKELPKILENAASVCEAWINEGFDAAVNRLSRLQSIRGEKE